MSYFLTIIGCNCPNHSIIRESFFLWPGSRSVWPTESGDRKPLCSTVPAAVWLGRAQFSRRFYRLVFASVSVIRVHVCVGRFGLDHFQVRSCPPVAIRDDACYCYSVSAAIELGGVLQLVHQPAPCSAHSAGGMFKLPCT